MTVKDDKGQPIAGVVVWLYAAVPTTARTSGNVSGVLFLRDDIGFSLTTGDDGVVDLPVPAESMNYLAARKEGFALGFGQKTITLSRGVTVNGQVLAPDGKPAAGVIVSYEYGAVRGLHDFGGVTDEKGNFQLKDCPAEGYLVDMDGRANKAEGACQLSARSPGMVSNPINFVPKAGQTYHWTLPLQKGLEVSGTVVDADTGKPLQGIASMAAAADRRRSSYRRQWHFPHSGSRLRVLLDQLRTVDGWHLPDRRAMWPRSTPKGHSPYSSQKVKEDVKDLKLPLKLRKLAPLAGKLVDEKGQPVAGATVYVHPQIQPATTSADGSFAIRGVPDDGRCMVIAFNETVGAVSKLSPKQAQVQLVAKPREDRECIITTPENIPAARPGVHLSADYRRGSRSTAGTGADQE